MHQVGKAGACVGIDVREAATSFSERQVKRLESDSPLYADSACPCKFETHNVFIPQIVHQLFWSVLAAFVIKLACIIVCNHDSISLL